MPATHRPSPSPLILMALAVPFHTRKTHFTQSDDATQTVVASSSVQQNVNEWGLRLENRQPLGPAAAAPVSLCTVSVTELLPNALTAHCVPGTAKWNVQSCFACWKFRFFLGAECTRRPAQSWHRPSIPVDALMDVCEMARPGQEGVSCWLVRLLPTMCFAG